MLFDTRLRMRVGVRFEPTGPTLVLARPPRASRVGSFGRNRAIPHGSAAAHPGCPVRLLPSRSARRTDGTDAWGSMPPAGSEPSPRRPPGRVAAQAIGNDVRICSRWRRLRAPAFSSTQWACQRTVAASTPRVAATAFAVTPPARSTATSASAQVRP